MTIVTLTTDFGIKDGNVGVMKGVILGIAPQAHLVDLSHMITPQRISEAALILARSVPYFPARSVHVVVVDPGVGTQRRPAAACLGDQFYVGPDNGTVTLWLAQAERDGLPIEFVHLDQPAYWLRDISHVFHGRDIFAPVAAHLANGAALRDLGTPFTDPVRLALAPPVRIPGGLRGEVLHADHFGNLSTNIRIEHLQALLAEDDLPQLSAVVDNLRARIETVLKERERFLVRIGSLELRGLARTFGDLPPGADMALIGSTGNLILSIVNGNFAERHGIQPGETVDLYLRQ